MVGTGNGGFAVGGRPGEKKSGPANFCKLRKFHNRRKFRSLENLQAENYSPAHYDTCKTED